MFGVKRMIAFLQFTLRTAAAFIGSIITWFISFIGFDYGFWASGGIAILAGTVIYYSLKALMKYGSMRKTGLTRREYKLVQEHLKTAKTKIQRLQKAFLSVSSLPHAKQNFETLRVVNKIYSVTRKEPGRFFKASEFYYSHLDSMVEIAEKYAFLSSQPAKTSELQYSLGETRKTMNSLSDSIKNDLYIMLEDDIDTLQFEIDVAKQSIDRKKLK